MSDIELQPPPIDTPLPIPTTANNNATMNTPQASAAAAAKATLAATPRPTLRNSFPERLQKALRGAYTPNMRRSVQTCVLFEADRCLNMQYKRLKPFQRKVALHDTASDIVETLAFIPPHYRIEIMYRTNTKKELLTPVLSWRRMKTIDRDIKNAIIPKINELNAPGKTHEQICNIYLQQEYEKMTGRNEPYHPNWEFSHDNNFTCYRMFYFGADVNPRLPPAVDPNPNRVVPSVKPKPEEIHAENIKRNAKAAAIAMEAQKLAQMTGQLPPASAKKARVSAPLNTPNAAVRMQHTPARRTVVVTDQAAERRALLKEIKDHIDILNQFKDIVPEETLIKRKRALFEMLPTLGTTEDKSGTTEV